jgi:hypothetical protein
LSDPLKLLHEGFHDSRRPAGAGRLCNKRNYYQFQIKDDLKAARNEAARRTEEYVEQPKTSQRREGLDMELA